MKPRASEPIGIRAPRNDNGCSPSHVVGYLKTATWRIREEMDLRYNEKGLSQADKTIVTREKRNFMNVNLNVVLPLTTGNDHHCNKPFHFNLPCCTQIEVVGLSKLL